MKQSRLRMSLGPVIFYVVPITLAILFGCSPKEPSLGPSIKALQLQAKNRIYLDQVMTISDQRHLLERIGFGTPLHSLKKLKGKTRRQ